ncbi:WD40-repeat-containing domain protein [Aspergillus carlsbadensis]|nr:WD40-repeat-containing domain protein [Aspergillus carlsbadensis]
MIFDLHPMRQTSQVERHERHRDIIGEVSRLDVHQQQKQAPAQTSQNISAYRRNHHSMFKEFERFATSYGFIIQETPLQTYSAALAFCPRASESKELYWREWLEFLERAIVMQEAWDPCMQVLDGHTNTVHAVAFSPDGQTVASASGDGTTVASASKIAPCGFGTQQRGVERRMLQGHTDCVRSVVFSPDGQTIASASGDGTMRRWDAATGVERRTLQRHMDLARAVAFSPDGQTVATASGDGPGI